LEKHDHRTVNYYILIKTGRDMRNLQNIVFPCPPLQRTTTRTRKNRITKYLTRISTFYFRKAKIWSV